MSDPAAANGLVVVHVRDQVNSTLAGHAGREYTSPPHQRSDALTLVALLLGRPAQPDADGGEQARWTCPLAGGQRTITLDPIPGPTATRGATGPVLAPPGPALAGSAAAETDSQPTGKLGRRGDGA